MPLTFQVREPFPQPPAAVFAALTDPEGWGAWMPGFVGVQREGAGPLRPGDTWRETRRMYGREATEHFEVLAVEPPARLSLRVDGRKGSTGRGEYRFEYRLAPTGGGTEVTLDGRADGMGWVGRLLGPLMVGTFRKACRADLAALRAHLSGGGAAS